mmetsp:Transcript_60706/g.198739  ORF Transcript_60706/g.198739 Transcript_60706/m.198739 type:complete len:205 (-) Transcript_60706:337-951(-)
MATAPANRHRRKSCRAPFRQFQQGLGRRGAWPGRPPPAGTSFAQTAASSTSAVQTSGRNRQQFLLQLHHQRQAQQQLQLHHFQRQWLRHWRLQNAIRAPVRAPFGYNSRHHFGHHSWHHSEQHGYRKISGWGGARSSGRLLRCEEVPINGDGPTPLLDFLWRTPAPREENGSSRRRSRSVSIGSTTVVVFDPTLAISASELGHD